MSKSWLQGSEVSGFTQRKREASNAQVLLGDVDESLPGVEALVEEALGVLAEAKLLEASSNFGHLWVVVCSGMKKKKELMRRRRS